MSDDLTETPDVLDTTRADGLRDRRFAGTGEMRAHCRALDWSGTALGPVERWPLSLRTIVATVLASRHPMFLWWGSELVQLYNDAYRPSLGERGRHPRALGMRGRECWTEIWDVISPQIEQVLGGGQATWHEEELVPIERNGHLEEVWWTYSYNPAFDDDGTVNGVLVVCQEVTSHVRARAHIEAARAEAEASRERISGPGGMEEALPRARVFARRREPPRQHRHAARRGRTGVRRPWRGIQCTAHHQRGGSRRVRRARAAMRAGARTRPALRGGTRRPRGGRVGQSRQERFSRRHEP